MLAFQIRALVPETQRCSNIRTPSMVWLCKTYSRPMYFGFLPCSVAADIISSRPPARRRSHQIRGRPRYAI